MQWGACRWEIPGARKQMIKGLDVLLEERTKALGGCGSGIGEFGAVLLSLPIRIERRVARCWHRGPGYLSGLLC